MIYAIIYVYLILSFIFQESPAVQKRLAVLGCQLRKAEVSKKTYEVATEKLLQFVEVRLQNVSLVLALKQLPCES